MAISLGKPMRTAASAICVVAAIGGISLVIYMHTRDQSDPNCKTVQDMIAYTRAESGNLENADGWLQHDQGRLSGVEDYQEWAVQMQHYAARVNHETKQGVDLAVSAHTLAVYSSAIVLLRSVVLGLGGPPDEDADPPPGMGEYNLLAYKVEATVDFLNYQCSA